MGLLKAVFSLLFQLVWIAGMKERIFPGQPVYIPGLDLIFEQQDDFGQNVEIVPLDVW